jgi:hypothetical protein
VVEDDSEEGLYVGEASEEALLEAKESIFVPMVGPVIGRQGAAKVHVCWQLHMLAWLTSDHAA